MREYFFNHLVFTKCLFILLMIGCPIFWGVPLFFGAYLGVNSNPLYWLIVLFIPISYYGFCIAYDLEPYFTKGWLCPECPPFPLRVYPRTLRWQNLRCKKCGHKLGRWEDGKSHLEYFLQEASFQPELRKILKIPDRTFCIKDLWDDRLPLEVEEK